LKKRCTPVFHGIEEAAGFRPQAAGIHNMCNWRSGSLYQVGKNNLMGEWNPAKILLTKCY
jgi:hypothetical protein